MVTLPGVAVSVVTPAVVVPADNSCLLNPPGALHDELQGWGSQAEAVGDALNLATQRSEVAMEGSGGHSDPGVGENA
jgi:hypothetical protein